MGNSALIVCVFQTHIFDALNYLIIIREHSNIARSKGGRGGEPNFLAKSLRGHTGPRGGNRLKIKFFIFIKKIQI